MARKGRPPITRERVLAYVEAGHTLSVKQVARETGADRSHVYRILWARYGTNFRDCILQHCSAAA